MSLEDIAYLSSLLGGDLALRSSLRGENLRGGLLARIGDRARGGDLFRGGLLARIGDLARGGDLGLALQLSLTGDRSRRGGVLDLDLRLGDRSRPGW